jgi:hypothetical protein
VTVAVHDSRGAVVADGRPPVAVELMRARSYSVVVARSTDTTRYKLKRGFNSTVLLNALVPVGALVDVATGSYNTFRISPESMYLQAIDVRPSPFAVAARPVPFDERQREVRTREMLSRNFGGLWISIEARDDEDIHIKSAGILGGLLCSLSPYDALSWIASIQPIVNRDVVVSDGETSSITLPGPGGYGCSVEATKHTTAAGARYTWVHWAPYQTYSVSGSLSPADLRTVLESLRVASDSTRAMTRRGPHARPESREVP